MSMIRKILCLSLILMSGILFSAEEEKPLSPGVQAVFEMFEAQGMREQMDHIRNVMLQNQLKEVPELMGHMYELSKFYVRYAGYDALKYDLAAIYLKYFTVEEIREITKFYRSPVGKKMRSASAGILLEANELARKRMSEGVPKFLEEMKKKGVLKK